MSLRKKTFGLFLSVLAMSFVLIWSSAALAQENTPKVDIFTGYSWYSPGATISGLKLNDNNKGGIGSFAYNFSKYFAGEVSGSGHSDSNNTSYFLGAGPRFTIRNPQFQPFIHALVGAQHLDFSPLNQSNWGVAIKAGGGFDMPLWKHVGIRLLEADYVYTHQNRWCTAAASTCSIMLGATDRRIGRRTGYGERQCHQYSSEAHSYLRLENDGRKADSEGCSSDCRHHWSGSRTIHGNGNGYRSEGEEGFGTGDVQCSVHDQRAAEASTNHQLLGESGDGEVG
jgi:hypothetical protein